MDRRQGKEDTMVCRGVDHRYQVIDLNGKEQWFKDHRKADRRDGVERREGKEECCRTDDYARSPLYYFPDSFDSYYDDRRTYSRRKGGGE